MANYVRANRTNLLSYKLKQALEALEQVKPLYTSTEYETELVTLANWLSYCASVADAKAKEDMV